MVSSFLYWTKSASYFFALLTLTSMSITATFIFSKDNAKHKKLFLRNFVLPYLKTEACSIFINTSQTKAIPRRLLFEVY